MKKILITIDWFLPGYKAGGPVSSVANLISHLKSDFQFYIITRNTDYLENTPYQNITADKWIDFTLNTKVFYISEKNTTKIYIENLIKETDFDTIYINGIYSYFFSILPLQISKKIRNKKIIVCARGMLSEQAFSRKSLKKNIFITLSKFRGFYKNIIFHATNENEKTDILKRLGKKANIYIAPNLPRFIENLQLKSKLKITNQLNLVSIARISQEKNTKFALQCLQNISIGNIIFDIFGSIYDTNYWSECENVIKSLPENIKVNYRNSINTEKVIETFSNYHFSLMPSVGENFGHSLLESMLAGTPVITSKNTPWKNLENENIGWDIDLNNEKKFKEVIENCLSFSQAEYNKLSENCFKFAKNIIEDKKTKELYLTLFQ